ncbi:MAG TPA: CsiV family protein [Gammaproteobacteria bacterium]|nr:CsiV family protein [Gammaproteobacteria bacterium]
MREPVKSLLNRWALYLVPISLGLMTISANAVALDYTVELVVYSLLQRDTGAEQWSAPRSLPDTEASLMLGESGTRMLEGPRNLQAIADTLRRSDRHRLLLHWHWQQPGWPVTQARPVLVQIPAGVALPVTDLPSGLTKFSIDDAGDGQLSAASTSQAATPLLDGTVNLIAGEILQVDVDLLYRDSTLGVPVRLQESRRLRSGELNYLDHPRFGVLVQVTPVSAAVTAPMTAPGQASPR